MRRSRIKAKFRANEPALVVCLHLLDACVYELTSLMGFDGIWMDLEHHSASLETATTLTRATRVGSTDIVARPAQREFPRLSRLLEAGAQAIMYPRCESAAEAEEVVRWAKFAPLGARGVDGANPDGLYCSLPLGDYLERANEETVVIIQIETPSALDAAEAIARVPGVDALMLGPGDLSVLSGVPFSFESPLVREATERVGRAAAAAGIHWGMPSPGVEHSRQLIDRGARFLCHGADLLMVKSGLEAIRKAYAGLGVTFDDRLGDMIARAAVPSPGA
jgi:4-hydroxy-2-oxoheptanedioate aldolase